MFYTRRFLQNEETRDDRFEKPVVKLFDYHFITATALVEQRQKLFYFFRYGLKTNFQHRFYARSWVLNNSSLSGSTARALNLHETLNSVYCLRLWKIFFVQYIR